MAALVLGVLVLHGTALDALSRLWQPPSVLRPVSAPLYTRVLVQTAAPPKAAAKRPPPPAARPAPAGRIQATAPPAAPAPELPATPPALAPAAAASAPDGVPAMANGEASANAPAGEPPAAHTAAAQLPASAADEPQAQPAGARAGTSGVSSAVVSAASAASASAASADTWPVDTRLRYQLSGYYRGALHGQAQVQWQREGPRYQVRIEVDIPWLAQLSMTSQGRVTPEGLVPEAYEETVRGRRRTTRLDAHTITLGNGGRVERPTGVQDTASQFVELVHRFATGRATLEAGRSVSFWMARPGGVDLWTYDVMPVQTLAGGSLGPIAAHALVPRPLERPRGNIVAEIWFAPTLQHLPARIRIRLGDEAHLDLLVDRIEQN